MFEWKLALKSKERTTLVEYGEIITDESNIVRTFNDFQ